MCVCVTCACMHARARVCARARVADVESIACCRRLRSRTGILPRNVFDLNDIFVLGSSRFNRSSLNLIVPAPMKLPVRVVRGATVCQRSPAS